MSARGTMRGTIRLAENPDFDSMDGGDGDDFMNDYQHNAGPEPLADENPGGQDFEAEEVSKGRSVRGPRTVLKGEDRISRLEKSMSQTNRLIAQIAKSQRQLLKHVASDFDPSGTTESPEDVEGGLGDLSDMDPMDDMGGQDFQRPPVEHKLDLRVRKSRTLRKDDAASSFGEQDDDTPGNRPFDPTETEEEDTMIQGGPGAGPGPLSKSMRRVIASEVAKALRSQTNVVKAMPPGPGSAAASMGSSVAKGMDTASLQKLATARSFRELNQIRTEAGLLPSAVI